jgi:hypothetical protein
LLLVLRQVLARHIRAKNAICDCWATSVSNAQQRLRTISSPCSGIDLLSIDRMHNNRQPANTSSHLTVKNPTRNRPPRFYARRCQFSPKRLQMAFVQASNVRMRSMLIAICIKLNSCGHDHSAFVNFDCFHRRLLRRQQLPFAQPRVQL